MSYVKVKDGLITANIVLLGIEKNVKQIQFSEVVTMILLIKSHHTNYP